MENLVNTLFDSLDKWRHFPAYQLERRADIFFSLYLKDFFNSRGYNIHSVIPEFPIRVSSIPDESIKYNSISNKSFKVDYLLKVNNQNKVIFLELKSDNGSLREDQIGYLDRAAEARTHRLLQGLQEIYNATSSKDKYRHLLFALKEADLINSYDDSKIELTGENCEIEIKILQPHKLKHNPDEPPKPLKISQVIPEIIYFSDFKKFVETSPDPLSKRFAESLNKWASITPGAHSNNFYHDETK